jgi:hypothetical protein
VDAAMQQQQLVELHDLIELDPHEIDRADRTHFCALEFRNNLLAQCGAAYCVALLVEPQTLQATAYTVAMKTMRWSSMRISSTCLRAASGDASAQMWRAGT